MCSDGTTRRTLFNSVRSFNAAPMDSSQRAAVIGDPHTFSGNGFFTTQLMAFNAITCSGESMTSAKPRTDRNRTWSAAM